MAYKIMRQNQVILPLFGKLIISMSLLIITRQLVLFRLQMNMVILDIIHALVMFLKILIGLKK